MKPELEDALRRDFPLLYKEAYPGVGDGWEPLVRKLSEALETEIINLRINTPINEWEENEKLGVTPRASQIKEKFAGLRFYMSSETEEMFWYISYAERRSFKICEYCGKSGKTRPTGWILTLCDSCYVDWLVEEIKRKATENLKNFLEKQFKDSSTQIKHYSSNYYTKLWWWKSQIKNLIPNTKRRIKYCIWLYNSRQWRKEVDNLCI